MLMDKTLIGIVAVVIAVLIVVAVFTLSSKSPSTNTTNTYTLSTIPQTSTIFTITPATPANSSVARHLIGQSTSASLFGAGGKYGAYSRTTPLQLQYVTASYPSYNVTAEYNMSYRVNSTHGANVISEVIFSTAKSRSLYSFLVSQNPYLNMTIIKSIPGINVSMSNNATSQNMVYSAASFLVSSIANKSTSNSISNTVASNSILAFQILFGYTSNSVVVVSALKLNSSIPVNNILLANITAKNLT
jgi:hypothetical protein